MRQRLRTRIAVPQHANLSLTLKHQICPPVSKAGPCMFQACTKGHCTSHFNPPPILTPFSESLNIRGGVVVPLSQSQTYAVFHLRTSQSTVVSGTNRFWLGSTVRVNREERRGGYTVKSQNISSKLFSSCAIISCSFFSFSCKSTPGKDSRLPN